MAPSWQVLNAKLNDEPPARYQFVCSSGKGYATDREPNEEISFMTLGDSSDSAVLVATIPVNQ